MHREHIAHLIGEIDAKESASLALRTELEDKMAVSTATHQTEVANLEQRLVDADRRLQEALTRAQDREQQLQSDARSTQAELELLIQQRVETMQEQSRQARCTSRRPMALLTSFLQIASLNSQVKALEQKSAMHIDEQKLAQSELDTLQQRLKDADAQVSDLRKSLARAEEEKNQAVTKASNELYTSIQASFRAELATKAVRR